MLKKKHLVIGLAISLFLGMLSGCATPRAAAVSGDRVSVSGKVLGCGTSEGLANVNVIFISKLSGSLAGPTIKTAGDGSITAELYPGEYVLVLSQMNKESKEKDFSVKNEDMVLEVPCM